MRDRDNSNPFAPPRAALTAAPAADAAAFQLKDRVLSVRKGAALPSVCYLEWRRAGRRARGEDLALGAALAGHLGDLAADGTRAPASHFARGYHSRRRSRRRNPSRRPVHLRRCWSLATRSTATRRATEHSGAKASRTPRRARWERARARSPPRWRSSMVISPIAALDAHAHVFHGQRTRARVRRCRRRRAA